MAARTVNAGFIVFTGKDGRPATGYLGDEVEVHKDDLERFDNLNPEANAVVEEKTPEESEEPSFSQADLDAAVKTAVAEKDAELAGARKAVEDKATEVAKEIADLATAKAEFEKAQADAAKAAQTPAKTAGK